MGFVDAAEVTQKASLTLDLVSNQVWDGCQCVLNTSGCGFIVGEGLGEGDSSDSTVVLFMIGGFDDQKIVATMKYTSPTSAGDEDLGVMLRFQTMGGTDDTFYYFRVDGQTAKITPVVDNAWGEPLASDTFELPQGTEVTITAQCVGSAISATFEASGVSTVNLAAVDTSIPSGGIMGARSASSTMVISAVSAEQP